MKRAIIGATLMLTGILLITGILITAGMYVPHITTWSGSKLWYAIFGAEQYGSEVVQSLFLGTPFIIGTILSVLGLIVLAIEFFNKKV